MTTSEYTDLEREVIILKAVTDLIDDMVNHAIFNNLANTHNATLIFQTEIHQQFFNVLLNDMLSRPSLEHFGFAETPPSAGSDSTFLYYLRGIYTKPLLSEANTKLGDSVENFAAWLDAECQVENVWLPSISLEATLRVPRITFIKICGDNVKHSFPRMSRNVKKIQKILSDNGHRIDIGQAYLALPDFYMWFHENIFAYHASAISEFLNNISWGIRDYLTPKLHRSHIGIDEVDVPKECANPFGKAVYLDLMNWVNAKPTAPQFKVTKYLKLRY